MDKPLLTARSALVLLLAVLSGAIATALSLTAGENASRSTLAGLGAAALAVPFFNRLIEPDQERTCRHTPEREEGEGRG
ncbi:hypothetical protein [Streptomyces olivochromogenes]|uniref:hypothetical protein n=1 Tax=Streptomyces olivochromogenes TaxID=1963 RepID=UPI001F433C17|nr:hypothetical protein [Streptomyces olivochromogenes]MCF3130138.1 hypothetical protein [Streptomyces olivochromogenes]